MSARRNHLTEIGWSDARSVWRAQELSTVALAQATGLFGQDDGENQVKQKRTIMDS